VRRLESCALSAPAAASFLPAFVGEAACFGIVGAFIGLPLGRFMATGAVRLMAVTVESLYVSSRPGSIELNAASVVLALAIGVGVAVASAYSPAREGSLVSPVEAMARGRREYDVRVNKLRDFWLALVLGLAAAAASRAPAVAGKALFGYLAAILLVAASALAMPAFVITLISFSSRLLGKLFGVEAMLASRSLAASLRRTSVLVGALSTAIAMMTAVGIMVGSFRQTVMIWMEDQLPPISTFVPRVPRPRSPSDDFVRSRRRTFETSRRRCGRTLTHLRNQFEGMPASLASADLNVQRAHHDFRFFSGRPREQVLAELRDSNAVVVSEPFTYKHHKKVGDSITLSLGKRKLRSHRRCLL